MESIPSAGNVFGNQISTFDSSRDFPQRISPDDVQRNQKEAFGDPKVKTSLTSEDGQNYGAIPMPMFASRPLIANSTHSVEQQRQQISELQFDKFPTYASFLVWKTRFKTHVSSGSDFPSKLCFGSQLILWT